MALPSTLYDFQISLSQVDRSFDKQLSFKVARHPSETLEHLWLRVLAYCWRWEERLEFGPGLSDPDAPDLEARDYTGLVTRWVRVGRAEPAKLQRAVHQNPHAKVTALFDAPERLQAFVDKAKEEALTRLANAELAAVDPELLAALGKLDERRHKLSVTVVGDHFYLDRGGLTLDGPLTFGSVPAGAD